MVRKTSFCTGQWRIQRLATIEWSALNRTFIGLENIIDVEAERTEGMEEGIVPSNSIFWTWHSY